MAEDGLKRLQSDLNAVMEKVQLCREIMLVSPGIDEDETLAGVVGFLEACRDRCEVIIIIAIDFCVKADLPTNFNFMTSKYRMGSLIEAGTQGELSEELFERCLSVNDAVCRTLDAERVSSSMRRVSAVASHLSIIYNQRSSFFRRALKSL